MFGSTPNAAKAYATVGLETGVTSASPHKLVIMLFEGAMLAISSAIHHLQAGDTARKGEAISKAIMIIESGLRASLDKKVGGEVALNLDALYEYMGSRLLIANLKNQQNVLEEVHQLLKGLKDAWESIAPAGQASPAAAPARSPYDALAPQAPSRLVKA